MSALLDAQNGSQKAATAERNEFKKKLQKMRKPAAIAAAVLVLLLELSAWIPEWKAKAALEAKLASTTTPAVSGTPTPVRGAVHLTLSRAEWSDEVIVYCGQWIKAWKPGPLGVLEIQVRRYGSERWMSRDEWEKLRGSGIIPQREGFGAMRFRGDAVSYRIDGRRKSKCV